MAKITKNSTSKTNCKSNKKKSKRFYMQQRLKSNQQKRKGSSNIKMKYPNEICSQQENDNHLQCSSVVDQSSINYLVDQTVDSHECITIEDDSTDKSFKLKNSFKKRPQFHPYPLNTDLKQQCNFASENGDLSQTKKQFEEDIKVLQDGIQSQIEHGGCRRINSDFYFNAIKRLNKMGYINKLLQEKEELEKNQQCRKLKQKLNKKCGLIINKISTMQSVYLSIKELVKFSMHQRKVIMAKVRWMRDIKKDLSKRDRNRVICDGTTFFPEKLTANPYQEMEKDNVSTDIPFLPEVFSVNRLETSEETVFNNNLSSSEVSSVIQPLIDEEKPISDNLSLLLKEQELSDAKERALMLLEQLKESQEELQKVRNEMNERVITIQQNADSEQMKVKVQLAEIRALLKEKMGSINQIGNILDNNMKGVTCQSLLWDIRWLVEEGAHTKCDEVTEHNTDTSITSDGLKVTENEVHLLILIAFFLKVIPFAVNTEFIHTYLKNIDSSISLQFVTSLMNKFPTVFKGESVGAGPFERKWSYLNLSPIITI